MEPARNINTLFLGKPVGGVFPEVSAYFLCITMATDCLLFVSVEGEKPLRIYMLGARVDLGTSCIGNGHGIDRDATPGQSLQLSMIHIIGSIIRYKFQMVSYSIKFATCSLIKIL